MERNIAKQNELINKLVKNEIEADEHINTISVWGLKSTRENSKSNEKQWQTFHHIGIGKLKKEFSEDNKRDLIDFVVNNEYSLFKIIVRHGNLNLSNQRKFDNKEEVIKTVVQYMDMLNRLEKQ